MGPEVSILGRGPNFAETITIHRGANAFCAIPSPALHEDANSSEQSSCRIFEGWDNGSTWRKMGLTYAGRTFSGYAHCLIFGGG